MMQLFCAALVLMNISVYADDQPQVITVQGQVSVMKENATRADRAKRTTQSREVSAPVKLSDEAVKTYQSNGERAKRILKARADAGLPAQVETHHSRVALPRELGLGQQSTSATSKIESIESKRYIISFAGARHEREIAILTSRLDLYGMKLVDSTIEIKNKKSPCKNVPCTFVDEKGLAAFNQIREQIGFEGKVIGTKNVGFYIKRPASNTPSHHSRDHSAIESQGVNRSPATSGSSGTFSYTNPNPNFYYISDFGSQTLGTYSPWPYPFSSSAVISDLWYEVSFYHTYTHDLTIDVGYDDTSLGGTTNWTYNFWNHISQTTWDDWHLSGAYTTAFNGLFPDSYYYIYAFDNANLDQGYLDYVDFEVYWDDYADLAFYNPGSVAYNNYSVTPSEYLTVNDSIVNYSSYNINSSFGVGWYAVHKPSGGCTANNVLPTFNTSTAFLVGYNTVSSLASNSYVNVGLTSADLSSAVNSASQYLTTGDYCLVSYVDDLAQVVENYESNNTLVFSNSFHYDVANIYSDLTFNSTSSSNYYSVTTGGILVTASAAIKNNSAVSVSSSFGLGWYLTPKPAAGCSALTVFDTQQSFFAGYTTPSSLGAGAQLTQAISNVDLYNVTNFFGSYMSTNYYCLWAFVDDLQQVSEYYENNNILLYNVPINYGGVGIHELSQSNVASISVYPNPTVSTITAELPESFKFSEVQVTVQNMLGQIVLEKVEVATEGKITLNVEPLTKGEYLVTYTSKGQRLASRFLKQ